MVRTGVGRAAHLENATVQTVGKQSDQTVGRVAPVTEARRTRDPARTRAALLEAAARALVEDGPRVSLDVVARRAGVSKGGLLHHFPTREALVLALSEHAAEGWAATVDRHLDPDDHEPGRLVRAYVRATLHDLADGAAFREEAAVLAALNTFPEVVAKAEDQAARWREAFAEDGLDPQRAAVLTHAADGVAVATLFEGRLDPVEVARMREVLLALSRVPGPLVDLGPA